LLFLHFYYYYSFIHMYVHFLGHFSTLPQLPPSPIHPPHFHAEPVLLLSLILFKKRHKRIRNQCKDQLVMNQLGL
jgi:hypothetical protein